LGKELSIGDIDKKDWMEIKSLLEVMEYYMKEKNKNGK